VNKVSHNKLKGGKAPGNDDIMSEHLWYSHPIISVLLSRLFRAMLVHGYVHCAFGSGIVIPLLKDANLDKTNMDKYRAITLIPVISKLFELYMLDILHDFLARLSFSLVSRPNMNV